MEIFSNENDALNAQVTALREEVLNLKTILIAHKDCPIAQQQQQHTQGLGNYLHAAAAAGQAAGGEGFAGQGYGMAIQGQQVMAGPRRYS